MSDFSLNRSLKNFHAIVNKAIAQAVAKGIHNTERVLLLLTETQPFSGYGYDPLDESEPHTADGQLIMPFGKNEQGQRQFLISFDPSSCDDKSHPDPSVQAGWDWEIFNQTETEQATEPQPQPQPQQSNPVILVLTRMKKAEATVDGTPGEIKGFSLLKMPDLEKFEQYAILVDPAEFTVQIRSN